MSGVDKINAENGWNQISDGLDGADVGLFSMDDGQILNGEVKDIGSGEIYFGPAEAVTGEYIMFPTHLVERLDESPEFDNNTPFMMYPDQKDEGGFYLKHSDGAPWEFKANHNYDFKAREQWHLHLGGWEVYRATNGSLLLGMAGPEFPTETDDVLGAAERGEGVVYAVADRDQAVAVPPNVPHRVVEERGDPNHIVTRYSEEADRVPKYHLDGTPFYTWDEQEEDFYLDNIAGENGVLSQEPQEYARKVAGEEP